MKWFRASLVIQIVLAIYFQAILWFPLGSLNAQPGHRLIELMGGPATLAAIGFAFALLLPVLLFALAVWRRWLWLVSVGLIGYGTWAGMQVQSWWIPWIFGANENALRNAAFLKNTFKLFPSTPNHPAPDAMHFVLDVLLFAAVATIVIGLFNRTDFSQQS